MSWLYTLASTHGDEGQLEKRVVSGKAPKSIIAASIWFSPFSSLFVYFQFFGPLLFCIIFYLDLRGGAGACIYVRIDNARIMSGHISDEHLGSHAQPACRHGELSARLFPVETTTVSTCWLFRGSYTVSSCSVRTRHGAGQIRFIVAYLPASLLQSESTGRSMLHIIIFLLVFVLEISHIARTRTGA